MASDALFRYGLAEIMFWTGLFSWFAALANAVFETRSRRDLLQGMSYVAWAGAGLLLFPDFGIYHPTLIWGWSIFLLLIQAVFVSLDIIALRKAKTEKVIVRAAATSTGCLALAYLWSFFHFLADL